MNEFEGIDAGIHSLGVDTIEVSGRLRAIDHHRLEPIIESMRALGLMHPIHVRMKSLEDAEAAKAVLVAGAHRLLAAKHLGWSHIDCRIVVGDQSRSEMMEIAENLHRADLTKKQRDDHIQRYAKLLQGQNLQSRQDVAFESHRGDGRGHRRKGVAGTIAEETGLSKRTVQRALKPKAKAKSKPKAKHKLKSMQSAAISLGATQSKGGPSEARNTAPDHEISDEVLNDPAALRGMLVAAWTAVEARDRTWLKLWVRQRIKMMLSANDDARLAA